MIASIMDGTRTSFGNNGGVLLTPGTAVTGEWSCAYILEDSTFTTLTTPDTFKNGVVTNAVGADWGTMIAGSLVPARITACTLATGKVLLVK